MDTIDYHGHSLSAPSSPRPRLSSHSRSSSSMTVRQYSPAPSPCHGASPPTRIILGLWPYACNEQIEYYVDGYRQLYPDAKLLLLPNSRATNAHIEAILTDIIGDQEKHSLLLDGHSHHHHHHQQPEPDTLLHLFGEDAAVHACRLLRAYHLRTARTLGVKSMVLDAAPVVVAPTWHTLRRAPHVFLMFAYLFLVAVLWRLLATLATCCCFAAQPLSVAVRNDLYDPAVLPAEARRCYIFPEKGIMFAWDRPAGADEVAERQDFAITRHLVDRETRWSGDQERYWLGIENAWEGR